VLSGAEGGPLTDDTTTPGRRLLAWVLTALFVAGFAAPAVALPDPDPDDVTAVATLQQVASATTVAAGETFTYTLTIGCSSITDNGCRDAALDVVNTFDPEVPPTNPPTTNPPTNPPATSPPAAMPVGPSTGSSGTDLPDTGLPRAATYAGIVGLALLLLGIVLIATHRRKRVDGPR
jgi:LPXTG-motif cell wall-anchored protein